MKNLLAKRMHNYVTAIVITGIPKLKLTGRRVLIYILKVKNLPFYFFVISNPLYKVKKFWTFATEGKFPSCPLFEHRQPVPGLWLVGEQHDRRINLSMTLSCFELE